MFDCFCFPFSVCVYSSFWFTCSFCLLLFVCFSYSLYSSSSFACSSCASFYYSLLSVPLFIVCSLSPCSFYASLYSFCSCLCLFLSPGFSVSFHSSVLSVSSCSSVYPCIFPFFVLSVSLFVPPFIHLFFLFILSSVCSFCSTLY